MSVIFLLIAASTIVAGGVLGAFTRAVGPGQFVDVRAPPVRLFGDDRPAVPTNPSNNTK